MVNSRRCWCTRLSTKYGSKKPKHVRLFPHRRQHSVPLRRQYPLPAPLLNDDILFQLLDDNTLPFNNYLLLLNNSILLRPLSDDFLRSHLRSDNTLQRFLINDKILTLNNTLPPS